MKKKIAVLCAAAIAAGTFSVMTAGTFSAMAADLPEKVEISFKVGDNTLTVNGAPMQVTAPYVVGDGTTLVPVRVITEAFGAEVIWNDEDQSVNLKYPDVDITIKIGSKSAVVNTHSEELAAAPEMFNDTTMVPLRFISETFGAAVDYNDGYITVTKENKKEDEEQSTVVGVTDKDFIGDSFYGWTIRNPKTFTMEERSFDGFETIFEDDEENLIMIIADEQEDDFDVDEEFNAAKQSLASGTISIADKTPLNDGSTKIHFRSKDKEGEYDVIEYVKGNRIFNVMSFIKPDSDAKDDILAIAQSFSITEKRDFYDLSNVVDGTREFKDETYGVSFKLPADWEQNEYNKPNEFSFHSTSNAHYAALGIYSKSDTVSAQQMAEFDRQNHVDIANPQLVTVNAVSPVEVNGIPGYRYTVMYSGFGDQTYVLDDTFLEVGDYVYNIAAACENMDDAEKIISTLMIEKLDSEKIGTILRDSEIGGTSKLDFVDGKVTAGPSWTSIGDAALIDGRTGAVLLGVVPISSNNGITPKTVINMLVDNDKSSKKASTVGNFESKSIDGVMYYSQTVTYKIDDKACCYVTYYAVKRNNKIYVFNYTRYDLYYGGIVDTEVLDIISSLEIK